MPWGAVGHHGLPRALPGAVGHRGAPQPCPSCPVPPLSEFRSSSRDAHEGRLCSAASSTGPPAGALTSACVPPVPALHRRTPKPPPPPSPPWPSFPIAASASAEPIRGSSQTPGPGWGTTDGQTDVVPPHRCSPVKPARTTMASTGVPPPPPPLPQPLHPHWGAWPWGLRHVRLSVRLPSPSASPGLRFSSAPSPWHGARVSPPPPPSPPSAPGRDGWAILGHCDGEARSTTLPTLPPKKKPIHPTPPSVCLPLPPRSPAWPRRMLRAGKGGQSADAGFPPLPRRPRCWPPPNPAGTEAPFFCRRRRARGKAITGA